MFLSCSSSVGVLEMSPCPPISLSLTVSFRLGTAALPDVPDPSSAQASLDPSSLLLLKSSQPSRWPSRTGSEAAPAQAACSLPLVQWSPEAFLASAKPGIEVARATSLSVSLPASHPSDFQACAHILRAPANSGKSP